MEKKVYIRTFGCQMNVRDSEVIEGMLLRQDYQVVTDESQADIIIYNTCSVRQHAEDKVWSEIGRFKKGQEATKSPPRADSPSAKQGHKVVIGIVGCMAQNYKDEIFRRTPQVDFAVGPSDIAKIPQIIKKLTANRYTLYATKIWETDSDIRPEQIYHTGFYKQNNHAYVVISEGCSNACSYCIVPYVRGELKNRNYKDIIKEIEEAVDNGIANITLLGQNVNAYQYNGTNFVKLLELVSPIKGLKEISFITSHPKDTSVNLFRAMRDLEKLKKYLHLPIQSGSDRILKLMNRGYTRQSYLDLIREYRSIVEGGLLSTDIIVGFPGETEGEFQDTYNLVKEVEFNSAYIFKYSPRQHTQAEAFTDDVPKQEKQRRHQLILTFQKDISKRKLRNG